MIMVRGGRMRKRGKRGEGDMRSVFKGEVAGEQDNEDPSGLAPQFMLLVVFSFI